MMKRVGALLIALAFGTSPLGLEACRIACATNAMAAPAMRAADMPGMHAPDVAPPPCHGTGHTVEVSAASKPCGHGDGATLLSVVGSRTTAIASAPVLSSACDFSGIGRTTLFDRPSARAPDRLDRRLSLPLRV